jgi:hypothetical protein
MDRKATSNFNKPEKKQLRIFCETLGSTASQILSIMRNLTHIFTRHYWGDQIKKYKYAGHVIRTEEIRNS